MAERMIQRCVGLLALALLMSCAALPPRPAEPPTFAIAASGQTPLQRVAAESTRGFEESGLQLLPVATGSLQARLALAARAEKSLDLQYFEWNGDETGRRTEMVGISPYLVPGELGMRTIESMRRRGVRMRVLTNSLAATDEPLVYGGYERYVVPMLRLGVEIHELSPSLVRQHGRLGRFGDSLGMLHAKIIVVDRARVFISSLNFDGRSERYNTELGVLIDSPEIAEDLLDMLDFEGSSYRLRLAAGGDRVEWVSGTGEQEQVHEREPEAGAWSQFKARFLGRLLPENWL
jgi:putative cardiolipin synthase